MSGVAALLLSSYMQAIKPNPTQQTPQTSLTHSCRPGQYLFISRNPDHGYSDGHGLEIGVLQLLQCDNRVQVRVLKQGFWFEYLLFGSVFVQIFKHFTCCRQSIVQMRRLTANRRGGREIVSWLLSASAAGVAAVDVARFVLVLSCNYAFGFCFIANPVSF